MNWLIFRKIKYFLYQSGKKNCCYKQRNFIIYCLLLFVFFSCSKNDSFEEIDAENLFVKKIDILTTDGGLNQNNPKYKPVSFLNKNEFLFSKEIIISVENRSGDFGLYNLVENKITMLTNDRKNFNPVFSKDKTKILYTKSVGEKNIGIYQMSFPDKSEELIYGIDENLFITNYTYSPDSKKICFAISESSENNKISNLFIFDIIEKNLLKITADNDSTLPKWLYDNKYIIFSNSSLTKLSKYDCDDSSIKEIANMNFCSMSNTGEPFTADSKYIFFVGGIGENLFNLNKYSIDSFEKQTFISAKAGLMVKDYRLSEDNSKLAVVITEYDEEKQKQLERIWIMNSSGSGLVKLQQKGDINNFPLWGMDGKNIVFSKSGNLANIILYLEN